ncbi:acetyl-CoA synthetase-like protein [Mycena latifolia]|nr:acetyl-CoA synthetase-like protein [Mycena latifolia]
MLSTSIPELDALLPLPDNILRLARADPERTLGFIVNEYQSNAQPVLTDITWQNALLDVHRRADELVAASGHPARNIGEGKFVVGLLLRNGYNYFVTLTAAIMLRWTSAQSDCLIVDSDLLPFTNNLNEPSLHIVKIDDEISPPGADFPDLWADYETADQDAMAAEGRNGMFAFLHTSGSTGHPKIIPWTHQWILTVCSTTCRRRPQSVGGTYYRIMPLFHSIGVLLTYAFSVGLTSRVHFLNLRQPPTSAGILRHLALHGDQAIEILLPPSILEDIVDGELREDGLTRLKRVGILMVAGAPLRQDVGDFLSSTGVRLHNAMRMTETGPLGTLVLTQESADWEYIELNDMYFFKPVGSGAREMILLPHENTPCVINHSDPEGFATSDLWEQHPDPEKSHLWRPAGRIGDVTILSNGEKTDNKQLENLLCASPFINAAIIFGTGRFLNGAIVCPPAPLAGEPEAVAYLDTVWPHIIENVNTIIPQHSRLIRPLVLVVASAKLFVLTDKQSIKRNVTLNLYADQIEAAYRRVEEDGYEEVALPNRGLPSHDIESITSRVALDDDLFDAGLESLLAMRIRSSLIAALKKSGKIGSVPRNILYALPSVAWRSTCWKPSRRQKHRSMTRALRTSTSKYTADFPSHQPAIDAQKLEGDVYAIAGTTGSLGSFFVSLLLNKSEVRKIYLLNRKTDSGSIEQRHQTAFRSRGLDYELLAQAVSEGRAVHLEVALGQKDLGLNHEIYDGIRGELTHIVHCAWLLNFNLFLPSFRTHVQGVRSLVDLGLASPLPSPPRFTFLSSMAVASLDTPAACLNQGYAHSKYVAEKVIERAVAYCPAFDATIIRSGQLSGAEGTGAWSATEHIPILKKSCVDFGFVPDGFPTLRWLPVNVAAQVVYLEIQASRSRLAFYNLENALLTPWSKVACTLARTHNLPVVSSAKWLEQVRLRTDHPANQLLAFFEEYALGAGMPALKLYHARDAAGNLVDYVVDDELIEVYTRYAGR